MKRYKASPQIVHTLVQDESVLLNLQSGQYHGLNQVGTIVWGLLEQGFTTDEASEKVGEIFELPDTELPHVKADVDKLVEQLLARGLISERGR